MNDGGPAFPVSTRVDGDGSYGHPDSSNTWQFSGMTLRDYFAAKAMQAIVSTITCESDYLRLRKLAELHSLDSVSDWISRESYKQADSMLKVRDA